MVQAEASPPTDRVADRPRFPLLRRLRRDQRGAAAVEMALVSIPFFALLGAIMEGALIFWSGEVLETAVHEASRQIYTGQFQDANARAPAQEHAAKFKEIVCNEVKVLMPCQKLHVDVRTYTAFPRRFQSPIKDGDLDPAFGAYMAPQPNQIVVVRAAVKVKVLFSLLHANKSNLTGSPERLVMASAAFRTEPFPTPATN